MIRSLIRTLRGPSRDRRLTSYVSRPLPRDLLDEDVVAALDAALDENPDPAYLVETLPAALREVTGRDYQVLDRSIRDVTGAFTKTMVMIRAGDVGIWPGYAARAYPMLAPAERAEEARRAIMAAEGAQADDAASPTNPVGKPGWGPPPPVVRDAPAARPPADAEADAEAGAGDAKSVRAEHGATGVETAGAEHAG